MNESPLSFRPSSCSRGAYGRCASLGRLIVALPVVVGCTKDPVEHFRRLSEGRGDDTTEAPLRTSEAAKDGGARPETTVENRDASVSVETSETTRPEPSARDAGEPTSSTSPAVETRLDAGDPSVEEPSLAERVEGGITEQCSAAPYSTGAFTRKALRGAAADCAMWHYCAFEVVARELDGVVQSYKKNPSDETRAEAQDVWRLAMDHWSRVELFQFGPLGSQSQSAGKDMYEGRGIRELIYAWPSSSACRVDEQLITQNYASRGMSSALISGRGLFALEYLLFASEANSACLATTSTAQEWSSLGEQEIARRKRDYAAAVSKDIVEQMQTLNELWSPSGGNFKATLVDASGQYPSEQEAMKVIAWSLIYAERELKDWKLGIPAGYTLTHPVSTPEAPYTDVGVQNIRANLRGFQSLFQGCGPDGQGLGFDDWLVEAGHPELAEDMVAALLLARQAAEEYTAPLNERSAALEQLYQSVRSLTSLLKSDFFGAGSPINLELPGGVEGDTD